MHRRLLAALGAAVVWATALDARSADPSEIAVTASLRLPDSREAPQWWSAAWQQLQQGQLAGGFALLEQLQREASQQFLIQNEVAVTPELLIEQTLDQLGPEARRQWEALAAPRAQSLWNRWQADRSADDLLQLARSYGTATHGLRAWQALAAGHRDAQRRQLAIAACEAIVRHPHATAAERASAVLLAASLWTDLGRPDQAAALHDHYSPAMNGVNVVYGGRSVAFSQAWQQIQSGDPVKVVPPSPSRSPMASAAWSQPLPMHLELQALWDEWQPEFRAAGVWLLSASEPLVVNGSVVTRTLTGLSAFDRETGALLWQTPPSQEFAWLETNPGMLENRSYRSLLVEQLYRRLLANSVLGKLTSNGELVFAVHDPRGLGHGSTSQRPAEWPGQPSEPRLNYLSAYRSATGELAWRVGGQSAGPTYPFGGVYFCGPPVVVDDLLFVVAQQNGDLRLFALQADDGQLVWSVILGETPRPIGEDTRRQRVACPVLFHAGLLFCPTSAGALVAVDPLTRSLRWAWRYPVESRVRSLDPRDNRSPAPADPWWDGWRDAAVHHIGDTIAFVSPESHRLSALDARTGRLKWSLPRAGGLLQIGATSDGVLIAEPTALRCHHADTGELRWRTPVGELTGRPAIVADRVIVPAEPHGLITLRLTDGSVVETSPIADLPVGNLAPTADGWFATSVSSVVRLAAEPPATLPPAMQRVALLRELAQQPRRWPDIQRALVPLAQTEAERLEQQLAVAAAAAQAGDVVAAAQRLLTLSERAPRDLMLQRHLPRRSVRADLAIVAAWDDLQRTATPEQHALLQRLLDESWQSARQHSDPFAPQRWREFWQPLPWTQRAEVLAEPRVFLGQPLLSVELALLTASDAELQPALAWQLSQTLQQAGFGRDASEYRRALLRDRPDARLPDGRTVAEAVSGLPPLRDPWPLVTPEVESQRGQLHDNIHHAAVPLDADSTPLFERLDVTLDRQGRRLRFSGAGQRGAWELTLPALAPARFESLRHDQELVQGWGRGRLLLVRVGADLFAVAPFDDRGEPAARLLWSLSLLDSSVLMPEQLVVALPGPNEEAHRLVDPFGRAVGQVGPVRASYLCYHESGRLICLETLTGRKRWERHGLPLDAQTFGDDQQVAIWSPANERLEWVRAIDGATLGQRPWQAALESVVLQRDCRVWRLSRTKPAQLLCEDAISGAIVWAREAPAGSHVVVLDPRTLGVLEPQGLLHVLRADDGVSRGVALAVELPPVLERVVTSHDAEQWYVAFSERTAQQAALRLNQSRQGYRVPIVTGPLYAIDQETMQVRWQIRLDREAWPIDQPKSLPILVQAYQSFATSGQPLTHQPPTEGILHLRDKRTGRDLLRRNDLGRLTYVSAWGDPDRGVIEVYLQNEALRLRYHPAPPAPDIPMP